MSAGMDGPHLFEVSVPTSHPNLPKLKYNIVANFG
jgi:hypothetical protein